MRTPTGLYAIAVLRIDPCAREEYGQEEIRGFRFRPLRRSYARSEDVTAKDWNARAGVSC